LVIDESWSLLERVEEASYIFEIVKTCRKFNLGLLLINQEVENLLESKAGKSVLANSSYTLLLKQKPAVINSVQNTFHLSQREREHLLASLVGEGILIIEDDHTELKIIASDEEHKLITTNPDELLEQNKEQYNSESQKNKQKKSVNIELDENKGFYKHAELSLSDVKYLLFKGYKESRFKSISGKSATYLLKPKSNESLSHCFLLHDIADYLKKFTSNVNIYNTVKPDIVFEINGKKIAVEVETGKVSKNKKQFLEKVKSLKKNYDDYFFILSNRHYVNFYIGYGKVKDKRTVKSFLEKYVKKLQNCPQPKSKKKALGQ
jgi:hypothetical protein